MLALNEALLVTLYIMGGSVPTQFEWNLRLFLVYMWYTAEIPMRPFKFKATRYGAWCHQTKKSIQVLEHKGFTSAVYSPISYRAEIDCMINQQFFEESITYMLTDEGEAYVKKVAKLFSIDIDSHAILSKLYLTDTMDIPYIISIMKTEFSDMIKR
jgi:hypothetical protein